MSAGSTRVVVGLVDSALSSASRRLFLQESFVTLHFSCDVFFKRPNSVFFIHSEYVHEMKGQKKLTKEHNTAPSIDEKV